eukprot:gene3686-biopygen21430
METIVNKEPPDKRTRPDRAAKIKDRKNGEENVVKCTLSRIIADKDNKDVITKVIKERVESVSKRTYLAGVAVNRILKEVFEGVPGAQLHTVSVPSVDQNFIRQLMVGSRQAHMETRDATVERFFHNNYWFREKIEGRETSVVLVPGRRYRIRIHPNLMSGFSPEVLHHPLLWDRVMRYEGIDDAFPGKSCGNTSRIFTDGLNTLSFVGVDPHCVDYQAFMAVICACQNECTDHGTTLHVFERKPGDGTRQLEVVAEVSDEEADSADPGHDNE